MSLEKKELIAKLEEILALYKKKEAIRSEIEAYIPEDKYERKIRVPDFPVEYASKRFGDIWKEKIDHANNGAVNQVERAYRDTFSPKEPTKPQLQEFIKQKNKKLQEKQEKNKSRSYIGAGVGIFFLLGIFSCIQSESFDVLPGIIAIALAGGAAFWFFNRKYNAAKREEEEENAKALEIHNQHQEEIKAEYVEKMKVYETERAAYELKKCEFIEDYEKWRLVYLQHVEEENEIADKLEKDRVAAVNKIHEERYAPAEVALNKANDFVPQAYLPVLKIIIDLLKSGRADDLKEAINLYEAILFRERQLALEREKEEQRKYEEQQRRKDEERRYREDMQFRQEQERQRQREEKTRQQDAERRHQEELKQRERLETMRQNEERQRAEAARRQAERAEADRRQQEDRDTRDQCKKCASYGHCSMRRPNCAAFRPR